METIDAPVQDQPTEQAPNKKVTMDEFAKKIKAKYPEYANVDNAVLTKRIIEKYPQYANNVDTAQKKNTEGLHDFTHGYHPTPEDIKLKQSYADLDASFSKPPPQEDNSAQITVFKNQPTTNDLINRVQDKQIADYQQDKQTRKLLGDKNYMASVFDQMAKSRADKINQANDPNSQYYKDIATQRAEDEKNAYHGDISFADRVKAGSNAIYRGLGTMGKGIVRAAGTLSKAVTPDVIGTDAEFDAITNKYNDAIDNVVKWAKDYHGLDDKKETAINKESINGMINGLAEFAPAIADAERTGGMSFFFNDYEKGYENIDKASKEQGLDLTEGQKQAYATVNGTVSALIMTHNLHSLLGNAKGKASQAVIDKVSHDVIGDLAKSGEDFNAANLKKFTNITLDNLEYKIKNLGVQAIKNSASSAGDLGALEALKIGTDKLTNTATGKQVFDTSNQAERMQAALKGGVILGAAGSLLKAPMLLAKGAEERNSVTESLYKDPSPENAANIKEALTQHLGEKGFTPEDIDHAKNIVDQIHQVAKSLPKGLPEEKQTKVVDLILQRKDLEKTLADTNEKNKLLDPAFTQAGGVQDLITQHRIDGINDQIKSIATDTPVKYFKQDGQAYKQFGDNEPEKIDENRYLAEKPSRTIAPNEQTKPNTEVPVEQPADEAVSVPQVADQNDETTKNSLITKTQDDGKNDEMGRQQNGQEGGQSRNEENGGSGEKISTPKEEKVVKSGEAKADPDTITVNDVKDKPITYKGEPAIIIQDGQTLVAKIKDSNREYELGNVDEIGDKSIKDLGIEHENSVVDTHENGNILVRGKEYVNNYSDPKSAINLDKDGNVVSVNLETPDGAKRSFKGDVAEDIAYQIHLKELNKDNESKQQFEQFVEDNEPIKTAIVAGEDAISTEKATVKDNATVSRKPKAENKPKPINQEGASAPIPKPYVEPKLTAEDVAHVTSEIQSAKPKESSGDKGTQSNSVYTKTADITSDPKQFQPRGTDFSEASTDKIVNNFDDNKLDPIVIYDNNGKDVVLSGHSRLEAHKRLDAMPDTDPIKEKAIENGYQPDRIKARYFKGTLDEAKEFADRSNDLGNKNKDYESAASIRKMRESGKSQKEINDRAQQDFGKDADYIKALSHLNPKGDVVDALKQLGDTGDKATRTALEKIASWIGTARQRFPELTNSHEKEMYDFLNDKKNDNITTKADFVTKIGSLVNNLHFKDTEPLNLNRIKSTNGGQEAYDHEYADLAQQVRDKQAEIDAIDERLNNPKRPDYIKPNSPDYDKTVKYAEKVKADKNAELRQLRRNLLDLAQKKGQYLADGVSQQGLFDMGNLTAPEHTELNVMLKKDDGLTTKDIENENITKVSETPTDAKTIRPTENDNRTNDSEVGTGKGTQSLSDTEQAEYLELRKQFSGQLNDVTRIPTLLADPKFRRYATLVFKDTLGDFKAFSKRMIDEVGEKIKEHLPGLFKELGGKEVPDVKENAERFVTSARNADTDKIREKLGLSPLMKEAARANPEVWDEVLGRLDRNPSAADDLIARLEHEMRPVTDIEQGLLIHKQIELETTVQEASQRVIDNKKNGVDDKFDIINLNNERTKLSDIIKLQNKVGREWGLSGKFRQQLYRDDFSLASLERNTMAAVGGRELTEQERNEIQKVHDEFNKKLKEHENIIDKLKKRNEDLEAEKSLAKLKKEQDFEFRRQKREGRVTDIKTVRAKAIEDIRAKLKQSRTSANAILPKELVEIIPDIGILAKTYIAEGVIKLDDIIDKIHHDLDIDGLEKRDVRDALSGYGKEPKKQTKSAIEQKLQELRHEAKLISKLEDLQNGIKSATKETVKNKYNEKIETLKKQIYELTKNETVSKSYITRMKSMLGELEAKLKKGDFEKTVRLPVELTQEARAARAAYLRVKNDYETELQKKRLAGRSRIEKAADWFVKWRRNVLFLNPSTFVKLGTYAAFKMLSKPFHELIGSGVRVLPYFSKIAAKAPREGHAFNIQAEAKAFAQIWSKSTWSDIKKNITNKEGDLQVINEGGDEKTKIPDAPLLDIGASLHSAIKQIPKHAEFERSLILRTKFAYEHGLDVSNQLVQIKNVTEALKDSLSGTDLKDIQSQSYQDALRDILMQDNVVSKTWSGAINILSQLAENGKLNKHSFESVGVKNAAKTLRATLQILIPITKVPVNYVIDRFEYTPLLGATRALLIMTRGLKKMSPTEADYVLRVMKKQGVGAGMLAFGYFNPDMFGGFQVSGNKRSDDELKANEIEVFGYKIPHFMTHTPFLTICQFGATLRHIKDDYVEGDFTSDKYIKATDRTGADAGIAATKDVVKSIPFMDTPTKITDALRSKQSTQKFLGDFVEGLVLPPDIKKEINSPDN